MRDRVSELDRLTLRLAIIIGIADSQVPHRLVYNASSSEAASRVGEAIRQSIAEPFENSRRLRHVGVQLVDTFALDSLPGAELLTLPLALRHALGWLDEHSRTIRIGHLPLEQWRIKNQIDAVLVVFASPFKTSIPQALLGAARLPHRQRGITRFSRLALVNIDVALNQYVAAHEFGHLLGLKHAPELQSVIRMNELAAQATDWRQTEPAAAACGWQCPELRLQSIMGNLEVDGDNGYTVVPVWSEPGVDWFGNRTDAIGTSARGVANLADEVTYLRRTLPQFVCWRTGQRTPQDI